jgi:hypothetical protein
MGKKQKNEKKSKKCGRGPELTRFVGPYIVKAMTTCPIQNIRTKKQSLVMKTTSLAVPRSLALKLHSLTHLALLVNHLSTIQQNVGRYAVESIPADSPSKDFKDNQR